MKPRPEILRALAADEDDRLLLSRLLDRLETCRSRAYMTATRFLDPHERALAEEAVRLSGAWSECVFFGGYTDAERVTALFFPDYLTPEQAAADAPVALLRAEKSPTDTLTHRDYLGALMSLQIERAMVGDILVHETGADIFVLREVADFLLLNFGRAGRRRITLSEVPLSDLRRAAADEVEGEGSVASLRLDSVAALIFGLSRSQAQEQISHGSVYLNHRACPKPDHEVGEGDRITLRGHGRAKVTALGGVSRKGRQFVRFTKSKL